MRRGAARCADRFGHSAVCFPAAPPTPSLPPPPFPPSPLSGRDRAAEDGDGGLRGRLLPNDLVDRARDMERCGEMWGDVGDSFPTISSTGPNAISRSWEIWGDTDPCSASRPNAAVIHYHATHGACSLIDRESVYLCDTGGQYLDGTTDVTRTLHFGSPTADERRAYTRVLQARAPHSTPPHIPPTHPHRGSPFRTGSRLFSRTAALLRLHRHLHRL